jgi:hypothetical protein
LRRRLTNFRAIIGEVDHLRVQKQGTQGLLEEGEDGGCRCGLNAGETPLIIEVTLPF